MTQQAIYSRQCRGYILHVFVVVFIYSGNHLTDAEKWCRLAMKLMTHLTSLKSNYEDKVRRIATLHRVLKMYPLLESQFNDLGPILFELHVCG